MCVCVCVHCRSQTLHLAFATQTLQKCQCIRLQLIIQQGLFAAFLRNVVSPLAHVTFQDLPSLNREINRLRQKEYRDRLRERPNWLPPQQKQVAVTIYILSKHCAQTAADYCARQKQHSDFNWKPIVEAWYLECTIEQLVAYELPEKLRDKRVHSLAKNWLAERRTATWVQTQNYEMGVAPASSALLDQYSVYREVAEPARITTATKAGRRFCQRFRKSWDIRLGTLKVRETMPDSVIKQKVRLGLAICFSCVPCCLTSFLCKRIAHHTKQT